MIQSKVAETISAWVETALELPFTIYCDLIPDEDADGACIRHDPTPAAEKRYLDGTRLVSWNFTFYTRCRNAAQAREYGKQIVDELDGATVTSDEEIKIDCEAVTLPQFIDTDAKGFTTYAESVKCTFLEE
ncbi:MAG: minor capsid protein [Treponema sp.]|nr:minor capsid protein [Treponema sp.]MBR7080843.1 minor capsid protein [Treponema sp.]